MSDDEIQILDSSKPHNLEDGELPDSPDINISGTATSTIESMDCDDVQIVEDEEFILDDTGAGPLGEEDEYLMRSMDTPVSVNFSSSKGSNSRGPGCFNCGGSHNLNDCSEEKNFARIQKNRRAYMENNKMKETRIYQGQLTRFKPGKLSKEARIALGVEDDEYPPWIYRMREEGPMTGYPPGWLERLMPKTDTLEFFTDDPTLCGEKKATDGNFKIDVEQVIFYEGFNDIDPDAEPERALKKHERNYPHYSKEDYAERLGKYVIRQYEQRLREEKEEEKRKKRRANDDNNDYVETKRVNVSKKKAKKLNLATKKALESFYNGWVNPAEILQKHEDGEIYLDDEELCHIKEAAEEDTRIANELKKIEEQRKVYGIAAQQSTPAAPTPKGKNKNKKKNVLFKDVEVQTNQVVVLDDDIVSEFQEFLKQKGKSNVILSQKNNGGNEPVTVSNVPANVSGKKEKKEKRPNKNKPDRNSGSNAFNIKQISKLQKEFDDVDELQSTIDVLLGKKEGVKSKRAQKKAETNAKKVDATKPPSGQTSQNPKNVQNPNKDEQKETRIRNLRPMNEVIFRRLDSAMNDNDHTSRNIAKPGDGIKVSLEDLFRNKYDDSDLIYQCCERNTFSGGKNMKVERLIVNCCDSSPDPEEVKSATVVDKGEKEKKKPKKSEKFGEGQNLRKIDKSELFGLSKESSVDKPAADSTLALEMMGIIPRIGGGSTIVSTDPDSATAKSAKTKSKIDSKKKNSPVSDSQEDKQSGSVTESKSVPKEASPDGNEPAVGNEGDQRSPRRIRNIFNQTMSSIINPIRSLKKSKKNKGDRSDSFPSEEEMTVEDAKRLQNLTLEDPQETCAKETSKKEKSKKSKGSKKLLEAHVADSTEARHDGDQKSSHTVGDHNMNHPNNSMEFEISESPASPTLPPVVSKYLTDDQAKPEPLVFPLIDKSELPTTEKWAEGITEFKYDNVIEGGRGLHRSIHEVLKNYNNSSK